MSNVEQIGEKEDSRKGTESSRNKTHTITKKKGDSYKYLEGTDGMKKVRNVGGRKTLERKRILRGRGRNAHLGKREREEPLDQRQHRNCAEIGKSTIERTRKKRKKKTNPAQNVPDQRSTGGEKKANEIRSPCEVQRSSLQPWAGKNAGESEGDPRGWGGEWHCAKRRTLVRELDAYIGLDSLDEGGPGRHNYMRKKKRKGKRGPLYR